MNDTPGRIPFDSIRGGSSTPTAFDRTPLTSFSETPEPPSSRSRSHLPTPSSHINTSLSLDAFQSRYTSEDNSSFATLLARDNELRKEKTRWAWEAEKRANLKQIRGREARERLVDVTREMVERSGDGSVWMLEGGKAGRPGERQVLVARGMGVGENDRGLVVGRDEKERLRITGGGEGRGDQKLILGAEGEEGDFKGKGKGKEVVRIDEKAKQFVDWDRPAVEEEQANRPLEKSQLQVEVETWPFKVSSSSFISLLTLLTDLLMISRSESKLAHVPTRCRYRPIRSTSSPNFRQLNIFLEPKRRPDLAYGRTERDSLPRYEVDGAREGRTRWE